MGKIKYSKYIAIEIILNSIAIFYTRLNSVIAGVVFFLFIAYSTNYWYKHGTSILRAIAITLVSIIPISFIPITGGNLGTFPLTWYHVLLLVAILITLSNGVERKSFLFFIIASGYLIITSILQKNIGNSLSQAMMIIIWLGSFFVCDAFGEDSYIYDILFNIYLASCVGFAIQILIQFFSINYLGIDIGRVGLMKARTAYSGLMGDYSFSTLFLATGLFCTIIKYFEYHKENVLIFISEFVLLSISSLIVTSRTGLFAFAVTLLLFLISKMRKFNILYFIFIIALIVAIPVYLSALLKSRGGQLLLDTSGRTVNYASSLSLITEKPLFGYGLGLDNLFANTGLGVPHNFFIQYLLQIGIIGTILLIIPVFGFCNKYVLHSGLSKWLIILTFIGSMLIPDIVSSRFLVALLFICVEDRIGINVIDKD